MIDSTTVTIAVTFQRNQLCTALLFPMYFTTSIHLAISILCQYINKCQLQTLVCLQPLKLQQTLLYTGLARGSLISDDTCGKLTHKRHM